ncbi:MAG TPA: inosine/xanthosine triphosphatase [Candidatus Nanoarchaeia archaeon]|nr:inosine/xanthosine triphosphatase [Candidatus Nanoarchaeia archaeon]
MEKENSLEIVVCTENKAKLQAVEDVFNQVYSNINIIGEKFPSGVSEQPFTESQGIEGAFNRVKNARKKYPNANFYVGMEGYVDSNNYGMFLGGMVVILDSSGKKGIGSSAKMQLPYFIQKKIEAGKELGPLIKDLMNDTKGNLRQYDGTNGLLSKGLYNRVNEFKDATKCALTRFQSPEFYNKE